MTGVKWLKEFAGPYPRQIVHQLYSHRHSETKCKRWKRFIETELYHHSFCRLLYHVKCNNHYAFTDSLSAHYCCWYYWHNVKSIDRTIAFYVEISIFHVPSWCNKKPIVYGPLKTLPQNKTWNDMQMSKWLFSNKGVRVLIIEYFGNAGSLLDSYFLTKRPVCLSTQGEVDMIL